MVDDKPLMEQVHECENLVANILSKVYEDERGVASECLYREAQVLVRLQQITKAQEAWRVVERAFGHMKIKEVNRLIVNELFVKAYPIES